jgi:hypothetical protein
MIAMGDWLRMHDQWMPIACSSGEAELFMSSGAVHILVAGPETDPGLIELSRHMGVPVFMPELGATAKDIFDQARQSSRTTSQAKRFSDPLLKSDGSVIMSSGELKGISGKMALIGGADMLQQSLGYLPVELSTALRGKAFDVAGWGDAAVWMIKSGLASDVNAVRILDARMGPLLAVKALASAGRLKDLKGICFTGLKRCQDVSMALGLAGAGCRVNIAVPVPVWGSEPVRMLLSEQINTGGGELKLYDHPAQASEIIEWFTI